MNMKLGKQKFQVFGFFTPEEVLPYAVYPWEENGRNKKKNDPANRRDYVGDDGTVRSAKMTSHRYWVFRDNPSCVSCGRTGSIMVLQSGSNKDSGPPHFNFYAVDDDGTFVLMTKDHIEPVAGGGQNSLDNYQTMCTECNMLKAEQKLTPEQVKKLSEKE